METTGGRVEQFFVRMLNGVLVGFAALLFITIIVLLIGAGTMFALSRQHPTPTFDVAYQPPVTSADAQSESGSDTAVPNLSDQDRPIVDSDCKQAAALLERVTGNQQTVKLDVCAQGFAKAGASVNTSLGPDYQGMLFRRYPEYLTALSKSAKPVDPTDESTLNSFMGELLPKYFEKFGISATAAKEQIDQQASARVLAAEVLAGAFCSCFLLLLMVSFLLVAIRVEKHLNVIQRKMAEAG